MTEGGSGRRLASGRYLLGDLLGGGGTADVFRATDTVLGRPVAIKLFRSGTEVANEQRFEREARLLAPLSHPGLVMIYDAGVEGGSVFLVLQLIDGVTVRQLMAAGTVPAAQVAVLGARLASVLAYVHAQGIVHRDMKPSNVLLTGNQLAPDASNVYLADFGISRLVDTSHLTATGMVVGTAAYMAPEQVMGRTVGPAADVYSLGLVLLECLTGQQEYSGASAEAAVARLGRSPVIPPHTPEPLRSVLAEMTAMDPAHRPSAATVAARLSGTATGGMAAGGMMGGGPATGTATVPYGYAAQPPVGGTAMMPGAQQQPQGSMSSTQILPGAALGGVAAAAGAGRGAPGGTMPIRPAGGGRPPSGAGGPGSGGSGGSSWLKVLAVVVALAAVAFGGYKLATSFGAGSGDSPNTSPTQGASIPPVTADQSPPDVTPSPERSLAPTQAPPPTYAPPSPSKPSPSFSPPYSPPPSAQTSPEASASPPPPGGTEGQGQGSLPIPSGSFLPGRIAHGR